MNARFQKVKGHTNLVRDKRSGVILNTNKSEIEQARKAKQMKIQQEERIIKLEQDMSDIKMLLTQIAEKL